MQSYRSACIRLVVVCVPWLFAACASYADSWGPPTPDFRSSNGQYDLHIGDWTTAKQLTLFKKTQSGANEILWSRPYVDDTFPPYTAYVADDGQHVVLRDVYHNLGYGKVLVFLGPDGNVLRSYELADLFTQHQILTCKFSVSSIWWSEPGWFALIDGDKQFAFATHFSEIQCYDTATGERISLNEEKRASIRARALSDILPRLKDNNHFEKAGAARLCGALKATEAVPQLKMLLGEAEPTTWRGGLLVAVFGGDNYSDVQAAAAKALILMLQKDAVPLIEDQLAGTTAETRQDLLKAIASLDASFADPSKAPDAPFLLATWRRLSQSEISDVRMYAIKAVLDRDEAQYVYDHPELLKDQDQDIRWHAVLCLKRRGDERAIPMLRSALHDSHSVTQATALSGLIKYKPDDILDILHWGTEQKDDWIRDDAYEELVRRGDKTATDWLIRRIAAMKDHTHGQEFWGTEEIRAEQICELVASLKLSAAEPALRDAYTNKCEKIRRPVCGALAALGDKDALRQLRQFARQGTAFDRMGSIKMLGLIGDEASIPALREMLDDREPWVREAAKDALAALEQKTKGAKPDGPGGNK
jgi:HEAT repeat protein